MTFDYYHSVTVLSDPKQKITFSTLYQCKYYGEKEKRFPKFNELVILII